MRIILRKMTKKEKQLAKLSNPKSDNNWTMDEAVNLLKAHGFFETGGKSSHRVFTSPHYDTPIILAAHGKNSKAAMSA